MKKLPGLVAGAGFPAVAVTDTNNLYGALEFAEGAAKSGLQPIIGIELAVQTAAQDPGMRTPKPCSLVLLAQNRAGYENLMALSSSAFSLSTITRISRPMVSPLSNKGNKCQVWSPPALWVMRTA